MIDTDAHISIGETEESRGETGAPAENPTVEANLAISARGEAPVVLDEGVPAHTVMVVPPESTVAKSALPVPVESILEPREATPVHPPSTDGGEQNDEGKAAPETARQSDPTVVKLAEKTVEKVVVDPAKDAPKAVAPIEKAPATAPVVKVPEDEGKEPARQESSAPAERPQQEASEPAEAVTATDGGSGAEPPNENSRTDDGDGEDDGPTRLEERIAKEQERERRIAARERERQEVLNEAAEVRDAFHRAHRSDEGTAAYNRAVREINTELFPPLADYQKPELQVTPSPTDNSFPPREDTPAREALSAREQQWLDYVDSEPVRKLEDIGNESVLVLPAGMLTAAELHYQVRTDANGEEVVRVNGFDVPPEFQGFGVGSRLMRDLIQRCISQGDIKAIEGLAVSEGSVRTFMKVFGATACEFFDPEVANLNHPGWEGRPDVIPMTPRQAVWSTHWGEERAGEESELFGDEADTERGVWIRARLDKYRSERPWIGRQHRQEEDNTL